MQILLAKGVFLEIQIVKVQPKVLQAATSKCKRRECDEQIEFKLFHRRIP